ncbi:hypothetical protein HDU99_003398 [Rhizoclosmatium hyalinum]|nr:hypothetical protein HDU99_003398 [Rhizoclosmatium hyalinum]
MERSPSSTSKISGILNQEINHRLRPRFWILILGFLAVTTITVGVLGWQLTFTTSQKNIAVLVDETEDIIADSIMQTILSDADVLQTLTATQASMLEKTNRTMRAMLVLLNRVRQFTTSICNCGRKLPTTHNIHGIVIPKDLRLVNQYLYSTDQETAPLKTQAQTRHYALA